MLLAVGRGKDLWLIVTEQFNVIWGKAQQIQALYVHVHLMYIIK